MQTAIRHKGAMGGIDDLDDLDEIVKLIGLYDIRVQQIDDEMQVDITRVKAEAVQKRKEIEAERAALLALCETYVKPNRVGLLGDRKTRKMNFGRVGFRKSTAKLAIPKKGTDEMADLVALIEKLAAEEPEPFAQGPIITEKYVQKSGLQFLDDLQLGQLDLERPDGEDVFFVQPDRAKLEEIGTE